jgi:hypothetical protein
MEARAGVEPAYPILQTGTSPLRHLAQSISRKSGPKGRSRPSSRAMGFPIGKCETLQCLAGEAGVEPATCRFRAGRSAN